MFQLNLINQIANLTLSVFKEIVTRKKMQMIESIIDLHSENKLL